MTGKFPWETSEDEWRGLINRVRAGRPLMPDAWPGGARCALALSFDCDHETFELGAGGAAIGRQAWGEFGRRRGVPRILDTLAQADVCASFFVPAVAGLAGPDGRLQRPSDAWVYATIRNGSISTLMPAYGYAMDEREVWSVIHSMRTLDNGAYVPPAPVDGAGGAQ